MSNTTSPPSDLDLWAARLLDAVRSVEQADRVFQDLSTIPTGGTDADRMAALHKLWSGLKCVPTPAATPERGKRFATLAGIAAPSAAVTFEGVLDRLLAELGRLFEAAPPAGRPVVLGGDFAWTRDVDVPGVGSAHAGCPTGLPDGHPARCGLREEDMLLLVRGSVRVVVLGKKRLRFYDPADVREKTLAWESDRRMQAGYEERLEAAKERQRAENNANSEWGRQQRMEALEAEIAALKSKLPASAV